MANSDARGSCTAGQIVFAACSGKMEASFLTTCLVVRLLNLIALSWIVLVLQPECSNLKHTEHGSIYPAMPIARRPLAPCYLGPPKEVEGPPAGYARIYHNRRRTAWTDYKLANEDGQSLSRQSTADTDLSFPTQPAKPNGISMSTSTRDLLAGLEAQHCIGTCIQRTKILEDALTYCRIPGYVHPCTDDGWCPLLIATQRRDSQAVDTLLEHGAEVNCKEPQSGWTPLMFAASLGDCETVKLLLKHGAAVNDFASPHDWNPLCAAIQANNKDIVRLLLHAGADISLIKKRHPALAEVYEKVSSTAWSNPARNDSTWRASRFLRWLGERV
ncbi:unnamed protein product [Effrenium voratum]|nr:unnamed protein product [Effrenium voratum]